MNRFIYLIITFCLASCTSIRSRYVGSQGSPAPKGVNGMPIVVERPRWLKVTYLTEKYALVGKDQGAADVLGADKVLQESEKESIKSEIVSVGEVYAMDLKRPLAGTADWDINFPEGKQYPKQVKNKVEDKSLEAIGELVEKVTQAGINVAKAGAQSGEGGGEFTARSIKISETVTLIEFYDIDRLEAGPVFTLPGGARPNSSYLK